MKLEKLTLEGFKSYQNLTQIDFTNMPLNQLFLIQGKTGAGKSSILDAITLALYGSGLTEFINHYLTNSIKEQLLQNPVKFKDQDIARIELEFEYNNKKYKIQRILRVKNFRTYNPELEKILEFNNEFICNNKPINQLPNIVNQISKEQFQKSIIIPQNQFDKFLKSNPIEKEEILKNIFNTVKYEEFINFIKKKIESYKTDINEKASKLEDILNRNQIEKSFQDPNIIEEFNQIIQQINNDINAKNNQIETNERDKKNKEEQKNQKEKEKEQLEEYKDLLNQQSVLEEKKPLIENEKNSLENAKKVIDLYPIYKNIKEIKESIQKDQIDLEKYQKELEGISQSLKETEQKKEELEKQKNEIDKKKNDLNEKEKIFSQLGIFKKIQKEIQDLENNKRFKEKELDNLKDQLEKFNNQLEDIYKSFFAKQLADNQPCPVCGSLEHPSPFQGKFNDDPEKILKQKKEMENLIQKLEKEIKDIEKDHHTKEQEISSIKKYLENNQYNLNNIQDIEVQLKSEIEQLKKIITDYDRQLTNILNKSNTLNKQMGEKNGRIEQLTKNLNEHKEKLNKQESNLKNLLQKENIKEEDIEKFYLPKEEIKKLEDKIKKYEEDKTRIESQIQTIINKTKLPVNIKEDRQKQIKSIEDYVNKLNQEIDLLNTEVTKLNNVIKKLSEEKGTLEEKNKNLQKDKQTFIKEITDYNQIMQKQNLYETLYKIISNENHKKISFHRYVIQVYFETIIQYANSRLKKIEPRYILKATDDTQLRKRLAGLNIKVLDQWHGERNIEGLSGGETFYVSLSLALGLYDIIQTNISNVNFDFLFIDEGFGSLDEQTLQNVLSTINEIFIQTNGYSQKQIGLISHVESMKHQIPYQIIITNKNGVSQVQYIP